MAAEVRFEKVSFAYPGRPVFSALELSFPAGITCITGPSGLGKTTLLRLALGLERPSAGRVLAPKGRSAMFQEDVFVGLKPLWSAEPDVRIYTTP